MKKMKVENVSSMKLDFFLKQNQEDVRVVLEPGESAWCDPESSTKSMILYERKNLVKITSEETINDTVDVNNDEALDKLHTTEDVRVVALDVVPVQPMSPPDGLIEITKEIEINENTKLEIKLPENNEINLWDLKTTPRHLLPEDNDLLNFHTTKSTSVKSEESQKNKDDSKKEKSYKGKKRGRKKKRGPKPGSKRNKGDNNQEQS